MVLTKREFIRLGSIAVGGVFAASHMTALMAAAREASQRMDADEQWLVLRETERLELAALADQIYPPDDSPGAAEIGAVRFMDAALSGFMAGAIGMIRSGLDDLTQTAVNSDPGAQRFSDLSFDAQTTEVRKIETTPFFATVHFMTVAGVFALPEYGGNRNGEGWTQIGFEQRHIWESPFGYYDARFLREERHENS